MGPEGISIHAARLQAGSALHKDSVSPGARGSGRLLPRILFQTYFFMLGNPSLGFLISLHKPNVGFGFLYNHTHHTYKIVIRHLRVNRINGPFPWSRLGWRGY